MNCTHNYFIRKKTLLHTNATRQYSTYVCLFPWIPNVCAHAHTSSKDKLRPNHSDTNSHAHYPTTAKWVHWRKKEEEEVNRKTMKHWLESRFMRFGVFSCVYHRLKMCKRVLQYIHRFGQFTTRTPPYDVLTITYTSTIIGQIQAKQARQRRNTYGTICITYRIYPHQHTYIRLWVRFTVRLLLL